MALKVFLAKSTPEIGIITTFLEQFEIIPYELFDPCTVDFNDITVSNENLYIFDTNRKTKCTFKCTDINVEDVVSHISNVNNTVNIMDFYCCLTHLSCVRCANAISLCTNNPNVDLITNNDWRAQGYIQFDNKFQNLKFPSANIYNGRTLQGVCYTSIILMAVLRTIFSQSSVPRKYWTGIHELSNKKEEIVYVFKKWMDDILIKLTNSVNTAIEYINSVYNSLFPQYTVSFLPSQT